MASTDTSSERASGDSDRDRRRRAFETRLQDRLRAIFEPGRWLIVAEITQAAVGAAARLVSMTGRDPEGYVLAVAGRHGVGPLDESIPVYSLDVPEGENMLEGIRLAQAAIMDLPADIQAAIDAWDPDHEARVIQPFTMSGEQVAGRPPFGARRPEWQALEDKLAILELWETIGVTCAPSRVIELADTGAAAIAHRELAGRYGTVWAVDNDQGWHGGIAGTYWVPDESMVEELRRRLVSSHRRVRIMPFLDGVPCSIHGMVIGGDVISFRPSEMLVFREPESARFVYGRTANLWDPPAAITAQMTVAAEDVGRELQRRVGFRGVFTLDGVAGSSLAGCEGFVPTEVNPRYGAALPTVLPTADGDLISLYFTNLAEVAGELNGNGCGISPGELRDWVRDRLLERRESRIMVRVASGPGDGERTAAVACPGLIHPDRGLDGTMDLIVTESEPAGPESEVQAEVIDGPAIVATGRWGTSGDRGVVFVELDTDIVPTGPIVGPQALWILRSLDIHWGLDLPELEAASPSGPAWTATSGPDG